LVVEAADLADSVAAAPAAAERVAVGDGRSERRDDS